ncbi:RNA recognition motif domain-containing protein, partial [Candidatus Cyanaurora vandensis]
MSIRLYVGNLPEAVVRQELEDIFLPSDDIVSLKLITDRKTGKCRGFGFLTVTTDEAADQFIEKFNGHPFKEGSLRIELAQPKTVKPESLTPEVASATPAPT